MSEPALAQYPADPRVPLLARRMGFLVAALAIIALPLIFNDTYWRTNLTICAINVLLALGLDFILGYAGQLNLGHSAFYGLGAYVFTTDKARMSRVACQLQAGMLSQNNLTYLNPCDPFGGYKLSGICREHGKYGFHDVTQIKVVVTEK